MKNDYSRNVRLRCSTCAGEDFEHCDEGDLITCVSCGRTYYKDELVGENGAAIDLEVSAIKDEVIKDVVADFRKIFSGRKRR